MPPILVKCVYWGLGLIERPIHTKFDIYVYIPTLNNTTKNYSYRCTVSDTSNINQTGIPGSWASNLIFRLAYQLLITLLKIIVMRKQDPVPPI